MKLVRESISFQRGLDPKTSLDVGEQRSENIEDYITASINKIIEDYNKYFLKTFQISMKDAVSRVFVDMKYRMINDPEIAGVIFLDVMPTVRRDYTRGLENLIRDWVKNDLNGYSIRRIIRLHDHFYNIEKWEVVLVRK